MTLNLPSLPQDFSAAILEFWRRSIQQSVLYRLSVRFVSSKSRTQNVTLAELCDSSSHIFTYRTSKWFMTAYF